MGRLPAEPGAQYDQKQVEGGQPGDYWMYDGKLIYVQKRFVAIPLDATPDGDLQRFDNKVMDMIAMTYDEMRPGCYEPKARAGPCDRRVDGSLPFPTFPRFCGQTFLEGDDKELGLACIQAYNDWMIEEWCGESDGVNIPLCLMPLWDVDLASRRSSATRTAARVRSATARSPRTSACRASTRASGTRSSRCATTTAPAVHAHRLVVADAARVARRAAGCGRHLAVQQLDGVTRRLALLGKS